MEHASTTCGSRRKQTIAHGDGMGWDGMLHLNATRVAGSWGRDEWRCATYNTKRRRESQEPGSSSITAILETLGVAGGCLGCV